MSVKEPEFEFGPQGSASDERRSSKEKSSLTELIHGFVSFSGDKATQGSRGDQTDLIKKIFRKGSSPEDEGIKGDSLHEILAELTPSAQASEVQEVLKGMIKKQILCKVIENSILKLLDQKVNKKIVQAVDLEKVLGLGKTRQLRRKRKRNIKTNTDCPHKEASHYAKVLC